MNDHSVGIEVDWVMDCPSAMFDFLDWNYPTYVYLSIFLKILCGHRSHKLFGFFPMGIQIAVDVVIPIQSIIP